MILNSRPKILNFAITIDTDVSVMEPLAEKAGDQLIQSGKPAGDAALLKQGAEMAALESEKSDPPVTVTVVVLPPTATPMT